MVEYVFSGDCPFLLAVRRAVLQGDQLPQNAGLRASLPGIGAKAFAQAPRAADSEMHPRRMQFLCCRFFTCISCSGHLCVMETF